jgi:hypothetical protein
VMVCSVVGARNEGSNSAASARSTRLPHFRTKARMELKIRGQSSVNIQKVMALRVGRFVTPKRVLVCEQVRLRLRVRARSHRGSPTRAHTQGMELKIGGERCFMMGNAVACFLSWSAASLGPATRAAILQRRRVSRGCHTFAQRLGWS